MEKEMRLIDANYALQQIEVGENENGGQFKTDSSHIKDFLNVLPTVDAVEVVRGRWKKVEVDLGDGITTHRFACSKCDFLKNTLIGNYCANCGAKMDKENID